MHSLLVSIALALAVSLVAAEPLAASERREPAGTRLPNAIPVRPPPPPPPTPAQKVEVLRLLQMIVTPAMLGAPYTLSIAQPKVVGGGEIRGIYNANLIGLVEPGAVADFAPGGRPHSDVSLRLSGDINKNLLVDCVIAPSSSAREFLFLWERPLGSGLWGTTHAVAQLGHLFLLLPKAANAGFEFRVDLLNDDIAWSFYRCDVTRVG